jgi:hypothetical protein
MKTRVCTKKTSGLRLAKRQKAEFTNVNEHFCCKRNEKIGVFLQTLITNIKTENYINISKISGFIS